MRKMLVVFAVISMMVSPVFAQEVREATGTVDSINPIDPARGDYEGSILLKDTASSDKSFEITTTTVISDQATGKIDSGDIEDGDKVRVTYSVSDNGPVAITILRMPISEVVQAPVVVDAGNKMCPVMGGQVSGRDFYEYNGKRYGLCCPMCSETFAKDPAKYAAIADKEVSGR